MIGYCSRLPYRQESTRTACQVLPGLAEKTMRHNVAAQPFSPQAFYPKKTQAKDLRLKREVISISASYLGQTCLPSTITFMSRFNCAAEGLIVTSSPAPQEAGSGAIVLLTFKVAGESYPCNP